MCCVEQRREVDMWAGILSAISVAPVRSMKSVLFPAARCLHEGRTVFEIPPSLGRATSILEMFQQSQNARQIHAAKTIRLFEMSLCGACIEYQRIGMNAEEGLAAMYFEHAPSMPSEEQEFQLLGVSLSPKE